MRKAVVVCTILFVFVVFVNLLNGPVHGDRSKESCRREHEGDDTAIILCNMRAEAEADRQAQLRAIALDLDRYR